MIIRFLFLIFLSCLASCPLAAKTLHAILVADTIHDIRTVTFSDLAHWQKELGIITQNTQMNLNERLFYNREFNHHAIVTYLQNLTVNPDDILLFYFSGHGYRTYQKETSWPNITFEFFKPGLDIQCIIAMVRSKKAQFSLIITDCCNNYIEQGPFDHVTKKVKIKLHEIPPHFPGYAELFSKAQGCIADCSCSEGQFSYGSRLGGLYTRCFFTSLNHELSEQNPSWSRLLQRADHYLRHLQCPICKIYP